MPLPVRTDTAPDYLGDSLVGWNEANPLYHLWGAFDQSDVINSAEAEAEKLEIANDAARRLQSALCELSLPDYNRAAEELDPFFQQMRMIWGERYVPPWYGNRAERSGVLSAQEYVDLRNQLGCPVPLPGYTPASPSGERLGILDLALKKPGWIFGGALVISGVVLGLGAILLRPRKKAKKKKGRQSLGWW